MTRPSWEPILFPPLRQDFHGNSVVFDDDRVVAKPGKQTSSACLPCAFRVAVGPVVSRIYIANLSRHAHLILVLGTPPDLLPPGCEPARASDQHHTGEGLGVRPMVEQNTSPDSRK